MSVEDEVELRDLVAQTLELNGCLPKIRAQLRANLFLALDEDSKISKQQPLLNKKVKSVLELPEGQLMFCLVREFLEYFDLDFTASVYEPESYLGSYYKYEGRQKIINDLGIKDEEDSCIGPVLLHLVKIAQTKTKNLKINLNLNGDESKESNESSVAHDEINEKKLSENENSCSNLNIHNGGDQSLHNDVYLENPDNEIGENGPVVKRFDSTFVKQDLENDDTFNGTSSIEEESVNGIDSKMATSKKSSANGDDDGTLSELGSRPETKSKSDDKSKSVKSEKLKPKLELPPLQLNKSRELLPSLYSKDFKDKSNKEYDFEIKDDYEEDFMSGSEIEFSRSKNESPKPLFEELQQCSEYTTKINTKSTTNKEQNSSPDNKTAKSNSTDIETNLSIDENSSADSKYDTSGTNQI